jgi:hypothetical protein
MGQGRPDDLLSNRAGLDLVGYGADHGLQGARSERDIYHMKR